MNWLKVLLALVIVAMTGVAIVVQPHAQNWWDKHFPTENEED